MKKNTLAWLNFDACMLGAEAAAVITLRMLKLARGDRAARREAYRMVQEKFDSSMALQASALGGRLGAAPPEVASKTLAHFRRRVRANRKRLMRAG
jgi:hypothetical protein